MNPAVADCIFRKSNGCMFCSLFSGDTLLVGLPAGGEPAPLHALLLTGGGCSGGNPPGGLANPNADLGGDGDEFPTGNLCRDCGNGGGGIDCGGGVLGRNFISKPDLWSLLSCCFWRSISRFMSVSRAGRARKSAPRPCNSSCCVTARVSPNLKNCCSTNGSSSGLHMFQRSKIPPLRGSCNDKNKTCLKT